MLATPSPKARPYFRCLSFRVAAYWTKLLPRAALARKLHQAVRHARFTLDQAKA